MKKFAALTLTALTFSTSALAGDVKSYELILKDHQFTPSTLEVPAGEKFELVVKNEDKTPAEFEMLKPSKREKIIKGGKQATIKMGPFKAGEYSFFDEFNEKTAQGKIIVK